MGQTQLYLKTQPVAKRNKAYFIECKANTYTCERYRAVLRDNVASLNELNESSQRLWYI